MGRNRFRESAHIAGMEYLAQFVLIMQASRQDVNLSLEPGLYMLEVFPRWKEKGSVSYGFLLKVQ